MKETIETPPEAGETKEEVYDKELELEKRLTNIGESEESKTMASIGRMREAIIPAINAFNEKEKI